ncbi:unnamed protein product, partial [Thlaspi arvense]
LRHPSAATAAGCLAPPVIFNFGDSNSDTGGLVAGLGYPIGFPNGRLFFRRSTGRLSDGRLLIDYLCNFSLRFEAKIKLAREFAGQSLNTSLLRPYLDSLGGSRFQNGANFAIVGSSTLPKNVPFSLNIQISQYVHFKSRSLELASSSRQNDIARSFSKDNSYSQTVKMIPQIVSEIKSGVKRLYDEGGRRFWIHNTGPLGCLPQKLSMVQKKELDQHGCLATFNSAAKVFNQGLDHMCDELRTELLEATIIYVDIYAIKYSLIENSNKYGFERPLMACCGYGGSPYNYNVNITCGHRGSNVCDQGSRFISWDGIHYTETANAIVAIKVLSLQFSKPPTPFHFFCLR